MHKDLGNVLMTAKRLQVAPYLHELLHLARQISEGLVYLEEVALCIDYLSCSSLTEAHRAP
jgi:hypothetical protein